MDQDETRITSPVEGPVGPARSVLSPGLQIDGDVTSEGPVEVTGRVNGSLRAPEITISATGSIIGSISAINLAVYGIFQGVIEAETVGLAEGAQVQADITYGRISIETGASFEGKLSRKS